MNTKTNEKSYVFSGCNRIFYLALPPSLYSSVLDMLALTCKASANNYTRLVVEKPFGKDSSSASELFANINKMFSEGEIYRIDHYLGKEMVQNLLVFRFSNHMFSHVWNRDSVECVMITFKETLGVEGRGGYFDDYGIIRDMMQNHLLQIMSLIAMEAPTSSHSNDIKNEKVLVFCVIPCKKRGLYFKTLVLTGLKRVKIRNKNNSICQPGKLRKLYLFPDLIEPLFPHRIN